MNGWMMLMFMKCKCKCGSQTPGVLQSTCCSWPVCFGSAEAFLCTKIVGHCVCWNSCCYLSLCWNVQLLRVEDQVHWLLCNGEKFQEGCVNWWFRGVGASHPLLLSCERALWHDIIAIHLHVDSSGWHSCLLLVWCSDILVTATLYIFSSVLELRTCFIALFV